MKRGFAILALFVIAAGLAWAQPTKHEISLPPVTTTIPEGPGKKLFQNNCTICHSARYVLTQPRFSRETWTAEVTKMRKMYGAPVSDADASTIVDYLVSIRGPNP